MTVNREKLESLKRKQGLHPRIRADAHRRVDDIFDLYESGKSLGLITRIEWFSFGGVNHRLTLRIDTAPDA